jgi:tRNA pseudouridine65 synthase
MELPILYQDEHIVAINKPHGLLVHRSPIAADAQEFALQILRDQLQKTVFPVHRLDRKTAGVLLFTFSKETLVNLSNQFMDGTVSKKYLAILRGHAPESGTIDYPLENESGKMQEAITHYKTLGYSEIPYALGKYTSLRYSLVLAQPETGRMHQLRRHFAHIMYPIIGDRPHGCNKQNRFFKETFAMDSMLLHASELTCKHPITGQTVTISAPISSEFQRMIETLQLAEALNPVLGIET